jgi:four helix bundle protein
MEDKKYQSFEDLLVWQEGIKICIEVYMQMKECCDFGFKDQIQRFSVSVPSNIAEGFERQTDKEFVQYLFIAKGFYGKLRTQLHLATELGYLDRQKG